MAQAVIQNREKIWKQNGMGKDNRRDMDFHELYITVNSRYCMKLWVYGDFFKQMKVISYLSRRNVDVVRPA